MIKILSRSARKIFASFFFTGFLISSAVQAGDPKTVFKQNCAVCHTLTDQKLTGPGLKGVADRAPKGDWLFNWIKDNKALIKAGDPYATKVFKENGNAEMSVFVGVISDEDIKALVEYIKNPPVEVAKTPAGGPSSEGGAVEGEAGISPLYIILAVIVILGLLISILRGVRISLRNITNKKEGREEEPSRTFWQEANEWMGAHRRFVGVCIIILVSIGVKGCWNTLFDIGVYYEWETGKGYKPEQPIKFSHKIHAGDNAIACQYCHNSVEKSRHAGIPTVNVCMNCHKGISTGAITGEKEISKIYAAAGFDMKNQKYDESKANPIKWIKVHNLPDHVYFNHSQHVVVGKVQCETCHGNVKEMTVAEQKAPLTMKWCIECHRKTEVAMEGNAYYDKLHEALKEKYKGQHLKTFTVSQMGGIECGRCHY